MRGKIRCKTKISDIILFLMFFWFVGIDRLQSPIHTLIKYIILLFAAMYIIAYIKNLLRNNAEIIITIVMIGLCIIYSTYTNYKFNEYNTRAAIFYAFMLNLMFCIFTIYGMKGQLEILFKVGTVYLLIILLVNDILAIAIPDEFYGIYETATGWIIGTFIVGNKFNVSYDHFILILFLLLLEKNPKKRNRKVLIYSTILVLICAWVQCTTMILGCVLFVVLYFIPVMIKELLNKSASIAIMTFLSAFMPIGFSFIISLEFVQNFIVNILHKDTTLTGRTEVYAFIFRILNINPLWGNGYGNTIVKTTSHWYANVQNAFWDYCINYGLVTTVLFVLLMLVIIAKANRIVKNGFNDDKWIIVSAIYVYLIIGTVEIIFGTQFYFLLALLNSMYISGSFKNSQPVIKHGTKIRFGRPL